MRERSHTVTVELLFALVLASIFFSSVAQRYLGNIMTGPNLDFYDYYFAAQVVGHDRRADLYAGATEGNPQLRSAPATSEIARRAAIAGFPDMELYLYPPLLADLLIPLAHLPPRAAATAWRAMNLGLVFASALLLAGVLRLPWRSFAFAAMAVAMFAFWPVHEAISLGQVSIVMLALWTLGIFGYVRGYLLLSAASFALCSVLKVTPILVVPLFLLWKERAWLAYYGGTLLALIAGMAAFNGPASLLRSFAVLTAMSGSVPALQNKCLGAVLAWLHYGRLLTLRDVQPLLNAPPHGLLLLAKPLSLLFYALCLFLAWRSRAQPSVLQTSALRDSAANAPSAPLHRLDRARIVAIFALVLAVISPVSWRHGYTVALIPLTLLWDQVLRAGVSTSRKILLAATSVALGSLCFDLAAQTPVPQPIKILCASAWCLCAAALCLEALWHASRAHDPAARHGLHAPPRRVQTPAAGSPR